MLKLVEFDLKNEWEIYFNIFEEYIKNTYPDDLEEIYNLEFKTDMLSVNSREKNRFIICKILKDKEMIGFCDYVCFLNENGKCILGNFYIYEDHRNKGYGTKILNLIEKELKKLGGTYIDVTPEEKAKNFYLRNGFKITEYKSMENGEIVYRKEISLDI